MVRSRVLSFMSNLGQHKSSSPPPPNHNTQQTTSSNASSPATNIPPPTSGSPSGRINGRQREEPRPFSIMGLSGNGSLEASINDNVPELLPILNCLSSHQNKLYQEGYFLKLNDLDTQGRPYHDRSWTECFAQLVGTVLSLWDAAALDKAETEGEVPATFINLGDASIKMIETLETRSKDSAPLQNVLSISTAGKNRYLLHFSNVNALTQWTAGIRLAMFEHSSLHETYTGALIGGKGRALNNIRTIMTHSKFQTSDWVRVRFGAGTPWRRCWCVISPPDEKEVARAQKVQKKRSTYDRSQIILKGNVKFYEAKKITKKSQPIATITNAYAAYAIYPQSKALIDQSTLIKIEGNITVPPQTETKLESFIFVMPEAHEAVSGFEMLLRFLFPIWDVFALYGRPQRLIPDTWNPKSLMFAMPKNNRWGYLDILDVTTLVTLKGSTTWSEAEWKKEMKKLTAERIEKLSRNPERTSSRPASQYSRPHRNSLPSRNAALKFADSESLDSRPSLDRNSGASPKPPSITGNAVPGSGILVGSPSKNPGHGRSVSASVPGSPAHHAVGQHEEYHPSALSREAQRTNYPLEEEEPESSAPVPPAHAYPPVLSHASSEQQSHRHSSEEEHTPQGSRDSPAPAYDEVVEQEAVTTKPPSPVQPVIPPPAFSHQPGAKPQTRPYQSPELRRANSRMSSATLSQLAAAAGKRAFTLAQDGGDREADKVNDAYNRPLPIADQNSNRADHLANNAASISEHPPTFGLPSHPNDLQAPAHSADRSVSPLRQMVVMTPEAQLPGRPAYFQDNSYTTEENRDPNIQLPVPRTTSLDQGERVVRSEQNQQSRDPSRSPRRLHIENLGATDLDEPTKSRNSSMGKITRKPLPPSPSRNPSEFVPLPDASPTDVIKNRDVDDALVNRVNTVKSKVSSTSRRYSEEGSHYESDTEPDPRPLPALPTDIAVPVNKSQTLQSAIEFTQAQSGPTHYQGNGLRDPLPPAQEQRGYTSTSNGIESHPSTLSNTPTYPLQAPPPVPNSDFVGGHKSQNSNTSFQSDHFVDAASSFSLSPERLVQDPAAAIRAPVYRHGPSLSDHQRQVVQGLPSNPAASPPRLAQQRSIPVIPNQQDVPPPVYSQRLGAPIQEQAVAPNRSPALGIGRKPVSPGAPLVRSPGNSESQVQPQLHSNEGFEDYLNYQQQQAYTEQQAYAEQQQQRGQENTYYDYGYEEQHPPPQQPHYGNSGQYPTPAQYASAGWGHTSQQQNAYTRAQYQGYNGPTYGQQASQDYYRPQQGYNNYSYYNQQSYTGHKPRRD